MFFEIMPISTHVEVWSWLRTDLLGRIILSTVVLLVGWYLSKLAVRLLGRKVARRFRRPSITRMVLRSVRAMVMFFAIVLAAYFIGIEAGDIVLSVAVLSVVVGIILAPIAGSIINGVFVLADRPFEIGDMIEIIDTEQRGFVEDITLRYTKIITDNNTIIVVPNSTIRERDVINYSAEDERTRLTLDITVSYEGNLEQAISIIERAARSVEDVITGGPTIRIGSARYDASPRCYIREFGNHGITLRLRYWVRSPFYLTRIRSRVHAQVWSALQEAEIDVTIPYPHSHLVFDESSGSASIVVDQLTRSSSAQDRTSEEDGQDPKRQ